MDAMTKRNIPFSPPDVGEAEIAAVAEALRSGWITTGPRTKRLERRLAAFIQTGAVTDDGTHGPGPYADRVACLASGTAAEELNLRLLGVGPGDEVIVPAYTYTATAAAAIHCGARVVLVDIQKDGHRDTHLPEMDYEKLADAITERTKAIIPVDLGGVVCDYDAIFAVAEAKGHLFRPMDSHDTPLSALGSRVQKALGRVAVVADSAHGLGAARRHRGAMTAAGALADFTSFSFHAVKNFTTAEGGAATWKPLPGIENSEIYRMMQLLSLHGQDRDALAKAGAGGWEYDVIGPWYKCNMTDVAAALGLAQLDRYPGLLARRREIIGRYDAVCDSLGLPHLVHRTADMVSSGHLYILRLPGADEGRRAAVMARLAARGVGTNVHYKPLPLLTAYRRLGWAIEDFPHAWDYYRGAVTLPLHTRLSDDDVDYVCACLREAVAP